jgi:ubiquinone/menaquinone biosynthesis C-methylase UbiE
MATDPQSTTANSLGQQLAHAAQLDGHFLKCQAEYEAMARAVGIQPGWHVLDAGCGTGVFLPLLNELVGPTGQITAIDVAPENRQRAQQLVDALAIGANITIQAGDVTQLDFADNTFDAIWCANVTQYLTDEQFAAMLQAFLRVSKPGGLVGLKEFDVTTWQFLPGDPLLMPRKTETQKRAGALQVSGSLRAPLFRSWLLEAGFVDVWLKNFVSECQPPLDPAVNDFLRNLLSWLANNAQTADISAEDKASWHQLGEVDAADHILKRPDFYSRESHILVVGRKT